MTATTSRSQRAALQDGQTDGKYRKVRPDTEVAPGTGEELMARNRSHLHTWLYDIVAQEMPRAQRAVPA
jgi:hypothetical protein